jgi:hypothetical protein
LENLGVPSEKVDSGYAISILEDLPMVPPMTDQYIPDTIDQYVIAIGGAAFTQLIVCEVIEEMGCCLTQNEHFVAKIIDMPFRNIN